MRKLMRKGMTMSLSTLHRCLIKIGFYIDRRLFDTLFSD